MRKRIFFLALFLSCIGGCVSSSDYATALNNWRGVGVAALVKVWGAPSQIVALANGNRLYVYQTPADAPPVEGSSMVSRGSIFSDDTYYTLKCTTWFEVNRNARIVDINFRGNSCINPSRASTVQPTRQF